MSFKTNLGKLVSVLMIGLPACAGQQVIKEQNVAQVQKHFIVQNEPQYVGVQLVYDSEVNFTDSFPVPDGVHNVKAWKDDERKLSIVEITYEDGFVERYWDSNEDKLWDAVEEVNGRIISFYSRIPESFLKECAAYRTDVLKSDEEKEQETRYWLQRLYEWQGKIAEFDKKYHFLKKSLKDRVNL